MASKRGAEKVTVAAAATTFKTERARNLASGAAVRLEIHLVDSTGRNLLGLL
jgi:hypothetical protein